MSLYHTKAYHVQLISNMVAEGITGELLESYIESAYEAAHCQGWEQAKREAIKEIQSNPIMYPVTVGGGIAGQYVVDTVAVNAIASMEYKGGRR